MKRWLWWGQMPFPLVPRQSQNLEDRPGESESELEGAGYEKGADGHECGSGQEQVAKLDCDSHGYTSSPGDAARLRATARGLRLGNRTHIREGRKQPPLAPRRQQGGFVYGSYRTSCAATPVGAPGSHLQVRSNSQGKQQ